MGRVRSLGRGRGVSRCTDADHEATGLQQAGLGPALWVNAAVDAELQHLPTGQGLALLAATRLWVTVQTASMVWGH